MNHWVLVLNQDYSPISICTIQRAFVLVFHKKVELLEKYSLVSLRTVSRVFPAPAVVRLKNYAKVPFKKVALTRQNIYKRDNFRCQYCGTKQNLTIDHVIPKARSGGDTWTNLVTACQDCNSRKNDNTPDEAGMPLLSKPFRPNYMMFLRDFSGYICDEWEPYLL